MLKHGAALEPGAMLRSRPVALSGPTGRRRGRSSAALAHRRGTLAVVLGVLVAVVLVVVSDIPTRSTASYRRSALAGYLAQLEVDVAPCSDGLRDAVLAAVAWLSADPTIQPGVAEKFTTQAVQACSFTNADLVGLAQAQPPQALVRLGGGEVGKLAPAMTKWAFPAAFTVLHDLSAVLGHPASEPARQAFRSDSQVLQSDRATVERLLRNTERAGGARVTVVPLASLGRLLPRGGLPGAGRS